MAFKRGMEKLPPTYSELLIHAPIKHLARRRRNKERTQRIYDQRVGK